MQDVVSEQTSDIDYPAANHREDPGDGLHRALRLAIVDLMQVSINARFAEFE
ncbi:hypothetical protein [Methylobacterium sp. WL103]|uniref:hypothetical protein n=1 Tax=Methylobacterium sp. WL103 TaxID=2603891 RepID=UPI001650755D|nr:hypothetical protein [Methylobacterium sp. WL103]